ncbi:hypothetical protein NQZ68_027480 [Dissostichus eleginoides]|nr:hypothetical protein NQZ68_027480 [Dissostichus eleginoides]
MMLIANTVFSDENNGSDVISTLSDVQLGAIRIRPQHVSFRHCRELRPMPLEASLKQEPDNRDERMLAAGERSLHTSGYCDKIRWTVPSSSSLILEQLMDIMWMWIREAGQSRGGGGGGWRAPGAIVASLGGGSVLPIARPVGTDRPPPV